MSGFTPFAAAAGGVLIGLAAALLWLGIGRIAGISGILGGLATAGRGDRAWRTAFLIGLMAAPVLYALTMGVPARSGLTPSPWRLILGGLLVGVGTRLGGGCTSGHGVCGLARFSRRSLAATLTFMVTAMATVFLLRHALGG
ncbi:YeeE/YedE family protein [Nitrospirillum iridis]|uniref:YeeE/YedE family protein n=1 Tax=Nitrospirillum iridis TaxID=765888 RepID=A0A7X0EE75_9PROT|nr:YeeE/YedE thiosulfate transporter family protein [Nitrospirillum iridis]MBB6251761.1 hypothetical protein [Nitrospirillum iridis]